MAAPPAPRSRAISTAKPTNSIRTPPQKTSFVASSANSPLLPAPTISNSASPNMALTFTKASLSPPSSREKSATPPTKPKSPKSFIIALAPAGISAATPPSSTPSTSSTPIASNTPPTKPLSPSTPPTTPASTPASPQAPSRIPVSPPCSPSPPLIRAPVMLGSS